MKKRKKQFLPPCRKWELRLKMVLPHLLVLYWRAGETQMVKHKRSEMAIKTGVILAHPNHRDNRCALELPSGRHDCSPPIQGFSASKEKNYRRFLCCLKYKEYVFTVTGYFKNS
jgi:hypothetical protein